MIGVDASANLIATPLGAGFEFDAIRRMAARWGPRASGLGDDAAVVVVPRGDRMVASVDAAVEGRHFRRDWLTSREIGYRAVTAALSDLAAMAAMPIGILVALVIPTSWRASLDDIADGILDALTAADTVILGGNLSDGEALTITTTVMGHAFAPLRRSGARPGDHVYVTGMLGGVGAAIDALDRGGTMDPAWRARLVGPKARVREARWLALEGATAAIDVSDGLFSEVGHLAAASGVRIHVEVSDIPAMAGVDPKNALGSGEEYELVVSSPSAIDTAAFAGRFDLPLTRIGHVETAADGVAGVILTSDGMPLTVTRGFDHFAT